MLLSVSNKAFTLNFVALKTGQMVDLMLLGNLYQSIIQAYAPSVKFSERRGSENLTEGAQAWTNTRLFFLYNKVVNGQKSHLIGSGHRRPRTFVPPEELPMH